jgi:cell division protease FtsH
LLDTGKIDRPDEPRGPTIARPTQGSSIPKAGKRFSGGAAPQGA